MTHFRRFSASFIAACLLAASGCAANPTRESSGEYIYETSITTRLWSAIRKQLARKVRTNVETYQNVVQPSGFADSTAEIDMAGSVAR